MNFCLEIMILLWLIFPYGICTYLYQENSLTSLEHIILGIELFTNFLIILTFVRPFSIAEKYPGYTFVGYFIGNSLNIFPIFFLLFYTEISHNIPKICLMSVILVKCIFCCVFFVAYFLSWLSNKIMVQNVSNEEIPFSELSLV
jgi:hypothetical protein